MGTENFESLMEWVYDSEDEELAENILLFLLQDGTFRKKFAKFLGYSAEIIKVDWQVKKSNQRHDIVLYRKGNNSINVELKGLSGFTPAQKRALQNKNGDTSRIHRVICLQQKKDSLAKYISDKRKTRILTWQELWQFFSRTKYGLFLKGLEGYFYSGEILSKKQLQEDIKQYLSTNKKRSWYETYAFLKKLTSLLTENKDKIYSNWSYGSSYMGKNIYIDYNNKKAYVFIGFFFEGYKDIEFFIETDRKIIAGNDLTQEEDGNLWDTFWKSKEADQNSVLKVEDYVGKFNKFIKRLENWKGQNH